MRISGFPRLNYFRNFFWKIMLQKVNTITTPPVATKNKLSDILKRNDIFLLKDPIIYLKNIKIKKIDKNKKKYFLEILRLNKQKNFIFLLHCFKSIIQNNKNVILKILGDGEDYHKLNQYIIKNNLQNNIFLEGYQTNVFDHFAEAEAFILSSLWEDPGFVLVEAAFANTTIISSDCNNGPLEILEKGKNGFLYKSNNKEDFLKIFGEFKNTDKKIIYKKKISSKKMSKKYSLFSHFLELKKII